MSQSVVVVDDQSGNSALSYHGTWSHLFGGFGSSVNGTLSYTVQTGDSITFKFNGTGVGVIGALTSTNGTAGAITSYTLDGAPPVVFTAPSNLTSTIYSQTFFEQQPLSPSQEHTLVINVTHAAVEAPFMFDYVGYIPVSTASTDGLSMTSMPTPSKSAVAQRASVKKSSPVGAIVGGVVGGVVLLALIVLGIFILRRRTRRRSSSPEGVSESEPKPTISSPPLPGLVYPTSPQSATVVAATGATHPAYSGSPPAPSSSAGGGDLLHLDTRQVYAKPPNTTGAAAPPLVASIPPPAPSHGLEPDLFAEEPDEVPPEYTEH